MKQIIAICMLLGAFGFLKQLMDSYQSAKEQEWAEKFPGASTPSVPENVPGLPASLESALEAARKTGADGIGDFLNRYRHTIRDPRLAEIELDYVVLMNHKNPAEARRVFRFVQQRTRSSSPLYERVKKLEKTYQ